MQIRVCLGILMFTGSLQAMDKNNKVESLSFCNDEQVVENNTRVSSLNGLQEAIIEKPTIDESRICMPVNGNNEAIQGHNVPLASSSDKVEEDKTSMLSLGND